MKPLFTTEEFNDAKSLDYLPCECYACKNTFLKEKHEIVKFLNKAKNCHTIQYCSRKCKSTGQTTISTVKCANCGAAFEKLPNQIKKSKNNFCSRSCAATYNNTHKTHGNRRSKLEKYIEIKLTSLYPNLDIRFNCKDPIDSELDIYIPDLNLAIELNGIFHYEPIFGTKKFQQTQNNDISKTKACINNEIDLCVIDTSHQKYFKESTSQQYLDIIVKIINSKNDLLTS